MRITFGEITNEKIGPISFAAGDEGLQRVNFGPLSEFKAQELWGDSNPSLTGLEVIGTLLAEMNEFLFGIRKDFSVLIDWGSIPPFQRDVLKITASIPYGGWRTYGEIADQLGKPGASRAVGRALGSNPMPIVIPCHRVVGADRRLHGYLNELDTKAFLLHLEGHQIEEDRLVVRL